MTKFLKKIQTTGADKKAVLYMLASCTTNDPTYMMTRSSTGIAP